MYVSGKYLKTMGGFFFLGRCKVMKLKTVDQTPGDRQAGGSLSNRFLVS